MLVYVLRRLLLTLSVVWAAVTFTFAMFFLGPTDPAAALCNKNCTPAQVHQIEKSMGLDKPKLEQYGVYMKGLVVGRDIKAGTFTKNCSAPCLGWSWIQDQPVKDMVFRAFPVTLSILIGGAAIYSLFGIIFGVISATHRGAFVDRLVVGISQFVPAIPYFILALLFYLNFMVLHSWIPRAQYTSIFSSPWQWFTGLIGVWLLYGLIQSTFYVRYVRASMIDSLAGDYVRTARSKGISPRAVTYKHALRAALVPFLTLVGLNIAADMGGAVFTEWIFQLNGMGKLAIDSFNQQDLQVISGVVVISAITVSLGNLVVDLIYGIADPRVKLN